MKSSLLWVFVLCVQLCELPTLSQGLSYRTAQEAMIAEDSVQRQDPIIEALEGLDSAHESTSSVKATVDMSTEKTAEEAQRDGPLLHYTDLFEGGATPNERGLMDWLYAHGFEHTGMTQIKRYPGAGRGMVFTQPVEENTELFAVPLECLLYTSNKHLQPTTKRVLQLFREHFRQPDKVAEDFELSMMALAVMFERRNRDSFFHYYLDGLQFPLCPAFYNKDKISAFEYPWLHDWRMYFLGDAVRNFEEFVSLPQFEFLRSKALQAEFMWAASTVLQRSFDWGPDNRREYVMVPYVDMMNHRQEEGNNYYYHQGYITIKKPTGNRVRKRVPRGMAVAAFGAHLPGDPMEISYSSASTNIQMLLQYGFVTPNNKNDYVVLQLAPPSDRPDFARMLDELGGVLASVPFSGEIPLDFVRAVALMVSGQPKPTTEAYTLIRTTVEDHLANFSSTLAEDEALLANNLSRIDYSIVMYRVEAKMFLSRMLSRIDSNLNLLEQGSEPSHEVKPGRKDWPLRHIVIRPAEGSKAPLIPSLSKSDGQPSAGTSTGGEAGTRPGTAASPDADTADSTETAKPRIEL